jgi:hypothetical protein
MRPLNVENDSAKMARLAFRMAKRFTPKKAAPGQVPPRIFVFFERPRLMRCDEFQEICFPSDSVDRKNGPIGRADAVIQHSLRKENDTSDSKLVIVLPPMPGGRAMICPAKIGCRSVIDIGPSVGCFASHTSRWFRFGSWLPAYARRSSD